ncbi:MAG: hypothetical protein ACREJ3_07415, partial [Polyangiaceae bacterium]
GRFDPNGGGWTDAPPKGALPSSLLFVSAADASDSLDHPASALIVETWNAHGLAIRGASESRALRAYLRTSFFEDHRRHYGGRPIYFPLS